jgi:hypothetical protein
MPPSSVRCVTRGSIRILQGFARQGPERRVCDLSRGHRLSDVAPQGERRRSPATRGSGSQTTNLTVEFREVPAGERIAGLPDIAADAPVLECYVVVGLDLAGIHWVPAQFAVDLWAGCATPGGGGPDLATNVRSSRTSSSPACFSTPARRR